MRRALVTGVGHRQGIGYDVASRLSERGNRVFVTRWGAFDMAREHSRETAGPWPSLEADLGDPEAPRGVLDAAEDAARLVAFLTSDEAGWITGQLVRSRGSV